MSRRLKLSLGQLHAAMALLQSEYGIEIGGSTIKHRSPKLDDVEATLHELVHGICLGDPYRSDPYKISKFLPKDTDAYNAHELTTLRVEIAVLERLGHGFSIRKQNLLLEMAQFWKDQTPPRAALHAPLTCAEEALALITAGLVVRAHRHGKRKAYAL